jgi:nitrogen fixation protein FixH
MHTIVLLRKSCLRLLMFSITLLLFGCGQPDLPPLAADQQRFQQQVDGVTITLDSSRTPQINQAETLRVTLHDAQGDPITTADVWVDLTMDMLCLSDMTPVATAVGAGSYEVITAYQMAGAWQVAVLARVGAQQHRAVFALEVLDRTE